MKDMTLQITDHDKVMNIVVETDNYKKVIKIRYDDIMIYTLDKEPKPELLARRKQVEQEFHNILVALQGDIEKIEDLVPIKIKAAFVKEYMEGEE
jgi:hypothetical protein